MLPGRSELREQRARSDLGEPELKFMHVLADIVAARVERLQGSMVRLTSRLGVQTGGRPQ